LGLTPATTPPNFFQAGSPCAFQGAEVAPITVPYTTRNQLSYPLTLHFSPYLSFKERHCNPLCPLFILSKSFPSILLRAMNGNSSGMKQMFCLHSVYLAAVRPLPSGSPPPLSSPVPPPPRLNRRTSFSGCRSSAFFGIITCSVERVWAFPPVLLF